MSSDNFRETLLHYFDDLQARVSSQSGDWTVKGFIDTYKRIYTISLDTKVLSKVLELLMFPVLMRFAEENDYEIILAQAQNQYPDLTLISKSNSNQIYAVDIKTTYRKGFDRNNLMRVSGMTLGTFGGYFRTRDKPVSSTLAYNRYTKHYVLGVIYSRVDGIDERNIYDISDLDTIPSVANDFQFFLQEKYTIASDKPGSGNTKNIGSTKILNKLTTGDGVFSKLGIEVFDDYWMSYRTRAMAEREGFDKQPYKNLKEYKTYKQQGSHILQIPEDDIETDDESE